jgi:hypothetical protein
MQIGLALPQYDYSVAGDRPLRFETIVEHARLAERGGADSVWLSDHLFLDLPSTADSERSASTRSSLAALARFRAPRDAGALEALRPRPCARRWPRSTGERGLLDVGWVRAGTSPSTRRWAWRCATRGGSTASSARSRS